MSNLVSVAEGKIVLYSTPDSRIYVDVVFKDETFWATQKAIAELFDVNVPAISKHLKNIFDEGELNQASTVSILETVQREGTREVTRTPEFYSLDAIIAVGCRVNSKQATRFRQWATATLKEYIQADIFEQCSFDGVRVLAPNAVKRLRVLYAKICNNLPFRLYFSPDLYYNIYVNHFRFRLRRQGCRHLSRDRKPARRRAERLFAPVLRPRRTQA